MTADSTGGGEKSFREEVNEELDDGQRIDADSDESVSEQVSDIRQGDEPEESGSQESQGSVSSTAQDGAIRTVAVFFGRLIVLLVGVYLIGSALGLW